MALSIAPATGQQTTTQNPQTVPTQTVGSTARSSGVQPGTATALLTSQQGESLGGTRLTTVSLDSNPAALRTATSSPAPAPAAPAHKIDAAWLALPLIFCVLAAVLFFGMTRSAKNTTIK